VSLLVVEYVIVNKFGDLIYIDLGGPIKPKSNRGYKYYISFLDYKTKDLDLDLLKSKKELINHFKSYYNKILIQDDIRLKKI